MRNQELPQHAVEHIPSADMDSLPLRKERILRFAEDARIEHKKAPWAKRWHAFNKKVNHAALATLMLIGAETGVMKKADVEHPSGITHEQLYDYPLDEVTRTQHTEKLLEKIDVAAPVGKERFPERDMQDKDYANIFLKLGPGLRHMIVSRLIDSIEVRPGTPEELTGNIANFENEEWAQTSTVAARVTGFGTEQQIIQLYTQAKAEHTPWKEEETFLHELGHIVHGEDVDGISSRWLGAMRQEKKDVSPYPAAIGEKYIHDKIIEDFAVSFADTIHTPLLFSQEHPARFQAMVRLLREMGNDETWDPRVESEIHIYGEENKNVLEIPPADRLSITPEDDEY